MIIVLTILGYIVLGKYLNKGDWWYRSTIGFVLGMIVKQNEDTIRKVFSRHTMPILMLIPFGLFCIYASGHFGIDMESHAFGFSLISLALIYILGIPKGKFITWIGKYSYEIYLCHPMAIAIYPIWKLSGVFGNCVYVVFMFTLTFVLSYILHLCCSKFVVQ